MSKKPNKPDSKTDDEHEGFLYNIRLIGILAFNKLISLRKAPKPKTASWEPR